MKKFLTKYFSRSSGRFGKSRAGATLIELVAAIAILGIVSSTCLAGMFALTKLAKRGQDISEAQRMCALIGEQFAVYGNTASDLKSYSTMPTMTKYSVTNTSGFMDCDHGIGDNIDMFIYSPKEGTIAFSAYNAVTNSLDTITTVDNISKIEFSVFKLNGVSDKFVLEYTITAKCLNSDDYAITSAVVLNNTTTSIGTLNIGGESNFTIVADSSDTDYSTHKDYTLRMRTTSKEPIRNDTP